MAVQARSTSSLLGSAVIAGIIGGIVVDTFLSISHHISPIVLWTGMAAAAAGSDSPWLIVALKTSTPWGPVFLEDVLGTAIFYALPMAYYLARASRAVAA